MIVQINYFRIISIIKNKGKNIAQETESGDVNTLSDKILKSCKSLSKEIDLPFVYVKSCHVMNIDSINSLS